MNPLADYYRQRAREYDRVYEKPERQIDIATLRSTLLTRLQGRQVLDVAAGTGFWTQALSRATRSITVTDINRETLDVAASREYRCPVDFRIADAFNLGAIEGSFDAAFVGFWWSHVRLEHLNDFLNGLVHRLEPASPVVVIDNRQVHGSTQPIAHDDTAGNTYQLRKLSDGTEHVVLKNFPSREDLLQRVSRVDAAATVDELTYYWVLHFTTPSDAR